MFSVVIPLYNKEKQIAGTLRSVFSQSYTNYEIVIVDDGSTDGSAAVVESLSDPRIRLIRQENGGVSAARNRGIAEARGKYIALLDADDEWRPEYLETIATLIRKYPQCDVFATGYETIDSDRNVSKTIINKLKIDSDGILDNYFEVASCSNPPLCSSTVVISKSSIQSIGGFPTGIKTGEDLITWAKLALKYQIAYSIKSSVYFLVDDKTQNEDQKKRAPEEFDYVGNELRKLYLSNRQVAGLKEYVSLWHKMRCRIFIAKYDAPNARKEGLKALKFKINKKNIVFLLLTLCPLSLSNKIISKFSEE